jgi:hypothetical protein
VRDLRQLAQRYRARSGSVLAMAAPALWLATLPQRGTTAGICFAWTVDRGSRS